MRAITAVTGLLLTAVTAHGAPDDGAAVRRRADALLAQMTPEEKAGQLTQYFYLPVPAMRELPDRELPAGRVGSLLFVTDPKETNRLQRIATTETRLKIPLLFGFDVIHGLRTIFPVPIGLAASWDPALVERAQAIAAAEARAVGIHWAFAPMLDIARDPRWGRIVEGPAKIRTWVPRWRWRRCAASRARPSGPPAASSRDPSTTLATAPLSAAATTTRRTSRTASSGTCTCRRSRGREGRRGQRDDRLHGAERRPRGGEPLAPDRRAPRGPGASRASW